MRTKRYLSALVVCLAIPFVLDQADCTAEEAITDILGVQVREQGHRCDRPLAAVKDVERSRPDAAVWVLKCEDATYRIRLVPDMAAHVEQLG